MSTNHRQSKTRASPPASAADLSLPAPWIRDLLRECPGVRLRLTGGSMAPAVRGGQVVEGRRVRPEEVRVGDIILYEAAWSPSGMVAHRVTEILPGSRAGGPPTWSVRGDAPGGHAEQVRPGQVLGRVEAVLRGRRWAKLTTPLRRALARWASETAAVWALLARAVPMRRRRFGPLAGS